ncbi:MAG: hypothetical protein QM485_13240 [Flavobacteriaceae bacterium]
MPKVKLGAIRLAPVINADFLIKSLRSPLFFHRMLYYGYINSFWSGLGKDVIQEIAMIRTETPVFVS